MSHADAQLTKILIGSAGIVALIVPDIFRDYFDALNRSPYLWVYQCGCIAWSVAVGLAIVPWDRLALRLGKSKDERKPAGVHLFYDKNDPSCYQPDGSVERIVSGSGNVPCRETIYRVGVKSKTALNRCRLVLKSSWPEPHDPGMHRIGLPMRPRIPTTQGSAEFTVNPNAPAYVDVLQEIVPKHNVMNEPSTIRLIYVNEDRGKANWFQPDDYCETFQLEGPDLLEPVPFRIGVAFDARLGRRCWRVLQADQPVNPSDNPGVLYPTTDKSH